MTTLESKLNPRSEDFKINAAAMQLIVDDLKAKIAQISLGGGEAAREKHLARGKLLPRDRVQMLLDPGTPFLEFSQLAAFVNVVKYFNMFLEALKADALNSLLSCLKKSSK